MLLGKAASALQPGDLIEITLPAVPNEPSTWSEQDVLESTATFEERGLSLDFADYKPESLKPQQNLFLQEGYRQFATENFHQLPDNPLIEDSVNKVGSMLPSLKRKPETNAGTIVRDLRITYDPEERKELVGAAERFHQIIPPLQVALNGSEGAYLGDELPISLKAEPKIDLNQQKRACAVLLSHGVDALLNGNSEEAFHASRQLLKLANINNLPRTIYHSTTRLYAIRYWCALVLTGIDRQLWRVPELEMIIRQCNSINLLADYEQSIALELARVLYVLEETPEAEENFLFIYAKLGLANVEALDQEVIANFEHLAEDTDYNLRQINACMFWHRRVLEGIEAKSKRIYPAQIQAFEKDFESAIRIHGGSATLAGVIMPNYGDILSNAGDWQSIVTLIEAMAFAQLEVKQMTGNQTANLDEKPIFTDTLGREVVITYGGNGRYQVSISP